jgi:hypothetical protein
MSASDRRAKLERVHRPPARRRGFPVDLRRSARPKQPVNTPPGSGRRPLLMSARFETPAVRSDRRKNSDLSKNYLRSLT